MKKIDTYYDSTTKIRTNIYETQEGLKVIESINKKSVDFDISFVVNAGSYYEDQLEVPHGTAHFLEHILFGNPNSFLKKKREFVEYKMGSKKRASFDANAYTTNLGMYLFAHGHSNAQDRMIKYIFSQILYPLEDISKYLPKERNIIIEEKNQRNKDENWEFLQFLKKVFGSEFNEFSRDILGEVSSIKSITSADLIKFYKNTFTPRNSALSVQTSTPLTSSQRKQIDNLSAQLHRVNPHSNLQQNIKDFEPKFKLLTYTDNEVREIFMSFNYFYTFQKHIRTDAEYTTDRLYFFMSELIQKVSFDFIREQLNLTYECGAINTLYLFRTKDRGFYIRCSLVNLDKVLEAINQMISIEFEKFLSSKEGVRWFNNIISQYIYLRNTNHDQDYAENIAVDILDDTFDKFDFKKAKEIAKTLTPEKLLEFTKQFFNKEPIIWLSSPYEEKEIFKIFKDSSIYKKYNK